MKSLNYTTNITDITQCDVLVVGGGPAGIAAAVAAARQGAKTVLMEQYGFVGGSAASALVGPFMTCYDGNDKQQVIKGFFDELIRRMEAKGGAIHPSKIGAATPYAAYAKVGHMHVTPFDLECLKKTAEDMLLEAGVTLLYYTKFVDCVVEAQKISHVIVAQKQGLCAIQAKCIVDASGDADVAFAAGVSCIYGSEKTGLAQPATLFFRIAAVNDTAMETYAEQNKEKIGNAFEGLFSWLVRQARANGDWNIQRDEIGAYKGMHNGEWRQNTTRVLGVDAADSRALTKATVEGRKQVQEVLAFLRKYVPGCEKAYVSDSAAAIGIRESRHIQGLYRLTLSDILNARTFEDDILLCGNAVDIHNDETSQGIYKLIDGWYGIPYRALVPEGCDNLLVAGRCISAESGAAASFRVMPCCFGMGQAAGTAAALCAQQEAAPSALDILQIQQILIKNGAFLNR